MITTPPTQTHRHTHIRVMAKYYAMYACGQSGRLIDGYDTRSARAGQNGRDRARERRSGTRLFLGCDVSANPVRTKPALAAVARLAWTIDHEDMLLLNAFSKLMR